MVDEIRAKIALGQYEFSRHAVDQTILRHITLAEILGAVSGAELLENYPNDKYGPSCLLLGFTASQRPLHLQCSHPSRTLIKVITVYEPDPVLWFNVRERRRKGDA